MLRLASLLTAVLAISTGAFTNPIDEGLLCDTFAITIAQELLGQELEAFAKDFVSSVTQNPEEPSYGSPEEPGVFAIPTAQEFIAPSPADKANYLNGHNAVVRARHGARGLVWSDTLANAARSGRTDACSSTLEALWIRMANLYAGSGTSSGVPKAISGWAAEVKDYNRSNPQASHWTQMADGVEVDYPGWMCVGAL
ncbi:hypothetical protein BDV98DRAFT_597727 [Pterulicium gracile]|uniref:SCP domain-containing protein n=1 Tax=Pterulicium gracile TaxID=1884261 RepID=A0A5C3Q2Y0_9AGAR|nr:hypothetical protein BDV98DRAFT_597727 [Pterula gracilis]